MKKSTYYTVVGHFRHKTDESGCSYPVILVNQEEYIVDYQEMAVWTILNWRFLRFEQIEAYPTSDHHGEVVLQLLCDPDEKATLDAVLSEDLSAPRPGLVMKNDTMDGDEPVLFGYTCDMPRIKRFDNAQYMRARKSRRHSQ